MSHQFQIDRQEFVPALCGQFGQKRVSCNKNHLPTLTDNRINGLSGISKMQKINIISTKNKHFGRIA